MSRSRSSTPRTGRATSGREAARVAWWRRTRDAISSSLSEHPVFAFEELPQELPEAEVSASELPGETLGLPAREVVSLEALSEEQRGPLFERHLMQMFQARLRVTSAIGVLLLPAFTAFYFYLFPATSRSVPLVCALGMMVSLVTVALTFAVKTLFSTRVLALLSFFFFTLCCAAVIPLVTVGRALEVEAGRAVQLVVMVSFIHILITSLILPLRLIDAVGLAAMVLGTMSFGFRAAPTALGGTTISAELWVVGTVAVLIALLCHFSSRLRRRVFDASFDMALQAARMKAISQTDALTGGFNRHHIESVLNAELARAARFGRPLSLLMFDLDNFKIVNDTLGHGAGDEVLQAIHTVAGAELREIDTLARFGGDEFLILLPETDAGQARRIAKRLHARVGWELPFRFGADSLPGKVSLSVGVLTLESGHSLQVAAILSRVDALLYSAKNSGKNQVVVGVEN